MSEKKKYAIRAALGVFGLAYIVGGLMIPLRAAAQSYYHWLGADWRMGADFGAHMLAFASVSLAVAAVFVAIFPTKPLEPKP